MKWTLSILISLFLIPIVTAITCEDRLDNGSSCLMITPEIDCSTYDIISVSNNSLIVNDASLTLVNGSIYQLNFTQEEGDYIVRLCDNQTREMRVIESYDTKFIEGKKSRMYTAIIMAIVAIIAILAYFITVFKSKDEEEEGAMGKESVRFFLVGICVIMQVVLARMIYLFAEDLNASDNILKLLDIFYIVDYWVSFTIITLLFLWWFVSVILYLKDSAKARAEAE